MMEDPNTNPVVKPDPVKPETTPKSVVIPEHNTVADNPVDPLSDRITPRQISTGMQRGEQTLSGTQIIYDDDNVKRYMVGMFPDGSIKAKLSQTGFDVGTTTDDHLIWSSDFNSFKIVETGAVDVAFADDGTASETVVRHNLGFTPAVLAFLFNEDLSIYQLLPVVGVYNTGADAGKVYQMIFWSVDSTTLTFFNQSQLQGTTGGRVKYYLLRETAN